MYTTEKIIVRKLVAELISDKQYKKLDIKYKENGRTIKIEIILTEEQIQNIARPNIIQLCFLALGLMVSGYQSSYALPFYEQRNCIKFTNFMSNIKENMIYDRLLLLDKLKLSGAFTSLFEEKFWPIFKSLLLVKLILIGGLAMVLDYSLSMRIGNISHLAIIPATIAFALLYLLRSLAIIIDEKLRGTWSYLVSKKFKHAMIESYKKDLFDKLND